MALLAHCPSCVLETVVSYRLWGFVTSAIVLTLATCTLQSYHDSKLWARLSSVLLRGPANHVAAYIYIYMDTSWFQILVPVLWLVLMFMLKTAKKHQFRNQTPVPDYWVLRMRWVRYPNSTNCIPGCKKYAPGMGDYFQCVDEFC